MAALSDHVDEVESIFHDYASKIDEADIDDDHESAQALPLAAAATTGETAIPIVAEEMSVGKRTVDAGGVRNLSPRRRNSGRRVGHACAKKSMPWSSAVPSIAPLPTRICSRRAIV